MDAAWWHRYIGEVRQSFKGELVTQSSQCTRHGIPALRDAGRPFNPFGNSGAGAIALAKLAGAARIVLIGYDCKKAGPRVHWHGDHPAGLGNAGSLAKWPAQFQRLATSLGGTPVVNCSRDTALTTFPRGRLEEVIPC